MDLARFNADDIHELRMEQAERRSRMSKEDAERDFQESAARIRCAIEELRRRKQQSA